MKVEEAKKKSRTRDSLALCHLCLLLQRPGVIIYIGRDRLFNVFNRTPKLSKACAMVTKIIDKNNQHY